MDIYHAYHLQTKDDIVIAFLSEWGFESFAEEETETIAYISERELSVHKNDIESFLQQQSIAFTTEEIQPKNWNAEWEESFRPVIVDNFCMVRADFHEPLPDVTYDLIINPKMAFGTGHHATTHMMIKNMQFLDFSDKTVFDYGAGTGILAVLAAKMGCLRADALDIELESFENIRENTVQNHVDKVVALHGTLDIIQGNDAYDIILANINRNVLMQSVDRLYALLKNEGFLLISGILQEDEAKVTETYMETGFIKIKSTRENNWSCVLFQKK